MTLDENAKVSKPRSPWILRIQILLGLTVVYALSPVFIIWFLKVEMGLQRSQYEHGISTAYAPIIAACNCCDVVGAFYEWQYEKGVGHD